MTRPIEARPPFWTQTHHTRACLGLLLTAGMALGALGACERSDPSGKAITGASRQLGAVAEASSSPGTAAGYLEPKLTAIRRDAKELGSDPSAGDTASANLISARASGGLAGLKAAQASELETAARRGVQEVEPDRRIRGQLEVYSALDAYTAQATFAAGLDQFDPAAESKRINDDIAMKEQEISKAAAVKRQQQEEAAKLETDAQAALSSAQAERTSEAQIRNRAQEAGGQGQTDLITQANQRRRVADGHDKKAADLRAQSAITAPRIDQADGVLNHLTAQRKLLQDALAEIQALAQSGKQRATEARAAAAENAEFIRAAVEDVDKTRAGIDAPTKAAIDGYRSAAAEARKAAQGSSREGKATATIAAAGYLADAGGVAAGQADGFRAYAALLEVLAEAKPALPGADKYATGAAAARKSEEEARKEATELFTQAKDAITGAGGGEELKAMTERVSAVLESLASNTVPPAKSLALGGEAAGGAAPAKAATTTGGGTTAPAASGAVGEIRAMLASLAEVLESGDISAIERVILLPDGPVKDLLRAQVDVDKAMREKFKVSAAEATEQAGLPSAAEQFEKMGMPSLAKINVTVSGPDTGSIGFAMMGSPLSVPVKRVNGAWALDIAGSPELQGMLGMMGGMFAPMTAQMNQFAADIRAGKYPDASAAVKAIEAAQKMGPGGG